jgi:hypothetical protein
MQSHGGCGEGATHCDGTSDYVVQFSSHAVCYKVDMARWLLLLRVQAVAVHVGDVWSCLLAAV